MPGLTGNFDRMPGLTGTDTEESDDEMPTLVPSDSECDSDSEYGSGNEDRSNPFTPGFKESAEDTWYSQAENVSQFEVPVHASDSWLHDRGMMSPWCEKHVQFSHTLVSRPIR